jgi:hypothetical protein
MVSLTSISILALTATVLTVFIVDGSAERWLRRLRPANIA